MLEGLVETGEKRSRILGSLRVTSVRLGRYYAVRYHTWTSAASRARNLTWATELLKDRGARHCLCQLFTYCVVEANVKKRNNFVVIFHLHKKMFKRPKEKKNSNTRKNVNRFDYPDCWLYASTFLIADFTCYVILYLNSLHFLKASLRI